MYNIGKYFGCHRSYVEFLVFGLPLWIFISSKTFLVQHKQVDSNLSESIRILEQHAT